MPPRIANPTPAARIAMKPANSNRLAFGAMASLLTGASLIIYHWVECLVGGLQSKGREFDNRAAFEGGLVGAEADTGPVGRLAGVGERVVAGGERGKEFVHEMRMRAAVAGALGETQMGLFREVI